jgi:hypothetical protein
MGRGKNTVKGVKFFYETGALLKNPAGMANPYAKRAKASAIALARENESEAARKTEMRVASNQNRHLQEVLLSTGLRSAPGDRSPQPAKA